MEAFTVFVPSIKKQATVERYISFFSYHNILGQNYLGIVLLLHIKRKKNKINKECHLKIEILAHFLKIYPAHI